MRLRFADDEPILEILVKIEVNTSVGNASYQIGPHPFEKSSQSLIFPYFANYIKNSFIFNLRISTYILILLLPCPNCC